MNRWRLQSLSLPFFLIAFSCHLYCGVNTSENALPVSPFYPYAATPAIVLAEAFMQEGSWEFEVSYYMTNAEPSFLGYNLYISTYSISTASLIAGDRPEPWLPNGIPPSFSHVDDPVSTESAALFRQRLSGRRPPPAPEPFYHCQRYYFRMTAYLRGSLESEPSPEIAVCASTDAAACPQNSSCYPL